MTPLQQQALQSFAEDGLFPVAVRVGRSGAKVHPAMANRTEKGRYALGVGSQLMCACAGAQTGRARNKAYIVREGWAAVTCGTSRVKVEA